MQIQGTGPKAGALRSIDRNITSSEGRIKRVVDADEKKAANIAKTHRKK